MLKKYLSLFLSICLVISAFVLAPITAVNAQEPQFTLGCYDSTVSSQIAANNNFVATQIFTKEDLPNGTEITIDYGYKYRPEGWVDLNQKNESRPSNKYGTSTVVVDDEWWGDYNYRAFNISKSTESDISGSYESVASHFKITLPSEIEQKTIRILAIGNSFSNDAMHYAEKIAAEFGYKTEFLSLYYSGCSLQKHLSYYESGESVYEVYRNGEKYRGAVSMKTVLNELDYDYITFQQASTYSATWNTFHTEENPYLIDLYNAVKSHQPNAKYYIHQTWGYDASRSDEYSYSSSTAHFKAVEECYDKASNLLSLPLIKSGKAIQTAKEYNYLTDDYGAENSMYADQYCHLSNRGDFIAGCVWVETLFGVDVTTKDFTSLFAESPYLCRAAHYAVAGEVAEEEDIVSYEPRRTMHHFKRDSGWSKYLYKLPTTLEANTEYTVTIATKFVTGSLNSSSLIFGLYGIDESTSVGQSTRDALIASGALLRSSDTSGNAKFTSVFDKSYNVYKKYSFTLTEEEVANKKFYLGYSFEREAGVEFYISDFSLYKSSDTTKTSLLNVDDYSTDSEGWTDSYGKATTLGKYVEYNPTYFNYMVHIKYSGTSTKRIGVLLENIIQKGVKYTISYDYYILGEPGFDYGIFPMLFGRASNSLSNPYYDRVVSYNYSSTSTKLKFSDKVGGVNKSKNGSVSYTFTINESETLRPYYWVGFLLQNTPSSLPNERDFYISNLKLTAEGSDENLLPVNEYQYSFSGSNSGNMWKENDGWIKNSGKGFDESNYVSYGTGDGNIDGTVDIRDLVKAEETVTAVGFNPFLDTNVDRTINENDINNLRYQILGLGIIAPKAIEKVEVSDITATKTASKTVAQTVLPGEKVTYTVEIKNDGDNTGNVKLTDVVPNGTEYVMGDLTAKDGKMSWEGKIKAGETATVNYTLKVNKDMSLCGTKLQGSTTEINGKIVNGYDLYIERTASSSEDQRYISNAIRALKDSTYRDIKLSEWIYTIAFTKSATTHFGATAKATLDSLLDGSATTERLNMVAPTLYGGSSVKGQITGIKGAPANAVTTRDLIVGDMLFVNNGGTVKNYIYDKDGLVDLSEPLSAVDTKSVLEGLATSTVFAVFRPTIIIERDYILDEEFEELELTPQQEAVIATAESYILRGEKLQYSDTRFGGIEDTEYRWNSGDRNPEFTSKDYWGYINCAGFTYEAYQTALGVKINGGGYNLWTTKRLATYAESAGIEAYRFERAASDVHDEATMQSIKKEVLDTLQPGDLMVVTRGTSGFGHVVMYIGNGSFIHSGGGIYTVDVGETYEPTIRYHRVNDYFFTEGSGGYLFYDSTKTSDKQVTEFVIVRPLSSSKFNVAVPTETQNRVNNLKGIMAQKLSSHNSTVTANLGEEVTFTFEVYNTNDTEKTVEICDTIPANTTYIEGADTVDGSNLSWSVTIPANTRKAVSYTVKVNENAAYGDYIQTTDTSTVGGVRTICPKVYINRTLTLEEQNKVLEAFNTIKANGTTNKGFALVNEIYKAAGIADAVFADTDYDAVMQGTNGTFKVVKTISGNDYYQLNDKGLKYRDMMVETLYGGRRYYGFSGEARTDRTRLARVHNLMIGDVIVRRVSGGTCYAYLYIGNGTHVNITSGFGEDSCDLIKRLELLLSSGRYYAVYRPSFAIN